MKEIVEPAIKDLLFDCVAHLIYFGCPSDDEIIQRIKYHMECSVGRDFGPQLRLAYNQGYVDGYEKGKANEANDKADEERIYSGREGDE